MNVLYKGARMIKDMYNQLNPATLTGAIDVLVIEQEDEELCASPFHVRFGKLGVLRAKEKLVNITINEEEVGLHMKLGDQGEAFFVVEADDEVVPLRLLTSPLPSRPSSPYPMDCKETTFDMPVISKEDLTSKRKRRKRRKKRSLTSASSEFSTEHSQSDSEEEFTNQNNSTTKHDEDGNHAQFEVHPSEHSIVEVNGNIPELTFRLTMCHDSGTDSTSITLSSDSEDNEAPAYQRLCTVFSDSELPIGHTDRDLMLADTPFSDSEAMSWNGETAAPMGWDWGQLPGNNEDSVLGQKRSVSVPSDSVCGHHEKGEIKTGDSGHDTEALPALGATSGDDVKIDMQAAETGTDVKTDSAESSPTKNAKVNHPIEGLYLDEILDLEPGLADLYFSSKVKEGASPQKTGATSNHDNEDASDKTPKPSSVASDAGVDSGTDCLISDDAGDSTEVSFSPMRMSLCGGKFENGKMTVDEEKFNEKLVTYDQFLDDPVSVTHNPDLIILLGEHYCDWETAGPLLLSVAVFRKPFTPETMERIINKQMSKKLRAASGSRLSWLWRRTSHRESTGSTYSDQGSAPKSKEEVDATISPKVALGKSFSTSDAVLLPEANKRDDESSSCEDEVMKYSRRDFKRSQTVQSLFPGRQGRSMKKTTRLSSDQLKSLKLKPGANTVSFSVTSQYQGTSRCYATIYLWKWNDKLVVSDIDGTITKSDVFGQILPVVGKDWTQGGVAQLYDNISKNGYKFIYLSARAIGQAGMTKGYLNWINQQGVSLPPGPLFLTPTSLMRAFHTEVIEKKPEKFKIQCLHDITALFPSSVHPLAAGFGNKANDVVAYATVGIPKKRIFTINHKGELRQEDLQTYTTSYSELGDIVDTFFPALDSLQYNEFSDAHEFSTFNYWRGNMPDISDDLGTF